MADIFNNNVSVLGSLTHNAPNATGDILTVDGTNVVSRRTPSEILSDIGAAAASHTHLIADVTDFTDNSINWDVAYGWGDHAVAGYLKTIDIDTFAELDIIVADKSLVNFEDGGTFTSLVGMPTLHLTGGTGDQGKMSWNTDEETVDIIQNGATLQVGQEIHYHVRNNSGALISNGTPVMATGTIGSSGRITVSPMNNDGTIAAEYFIGIATEDIANDTDGKITEFGKIRGIQTNGANYGEAWVDGDLIYLDGTTAGDLTKTQPTSPAYKAPIAIVINSHASAGTLFVRVYGNQGIHELHDVQLTSIANEDVIRWNSTNLRFENYSSTNWDTAFGWGDHASGGYELLANKGAASGYVPLDSGSKIPNTYLPPLAISETFVVANEAAQLALTVQEGDIAVRTDENKSYIALNATNATMADWQELLTPTDAVQSVNGLTGTVILNLTFNSGDLSITGGNTVDLDSRYSLLGHTHTLSEVTDVTASFTELNLLDLAGLTVGRVLAADGAAAASWRQLLGSEISNDLGWITSASLATIGSADQIPFVNAGGTDFEYSANFTWNDSDLVLYDPTNDGNPTISIGASATEKFAINTFYNPVTQVLDRVEFRTSTGSLTAEDGRYQFYVDDSLKFSILDSWVEFSGAVDVRIAEGKKVIYDGDGDSFAYTISDTSNTLGFGINSMVHASNGADHIFINGDGGARNRIQSSSILFTNTADQILTTADAIDIVAANGSFSTSASLRINDAAGQMTASQVDLLLPDGQIYVGTNDVGQGILNLYGAATTNGGETRFYAAADSDTTVDYWRARVAGTTFIINGNTSSTGNLQLTSTLAHLNSPDGSKGVQVTNNDVSINGTIVANTVVNEGVAATKILTVDSSNNVDFRTPAELLSDIGAQAAADYLRADIADVKTTGDLTFNDGISIRFGTDTDAQIYYNNATNDIRFSLINVDDFRIEDNGASRFRFVKASGDFHLDTGDINLGDNQQVRLGDSQDSEIFFGGSNTFWDLNIGNLIIRDATTEIFRFERANRRFSIGDTGPDYTFVANSQAADASGENIVAQFAGGDSLSTSGDSTVLLLSNRGSTNLYSAKISLENTATSPSFLNPQLDFKLQDNNTSAIGNVTTKLRLKSTGQVQFNDYGSGTNTGTVTYQLAVDASGNIIENTGGNADTLDSLDSTQFLRSDVSDIKTSGDLRFDDAIAINWGTDVDAEQYYNNSSAQLRFNLITGGSIHFQDNDTTRTSWSRSSGQWSMASDINAAYATTNLAEFEDANDTLIVKNVNNAISNGYTSIYMEHLGLSGRGTGRFNMINLSAGRSAFTWQLRDDAHTTDMREKMRLEGDGNLDLIDGNLVVADGYGLQSSSLVAVGVFIPASDGIDITAFGDTIFSNWGGASYDEIMRIDASTGKVGIGTISPSAKLDVIVPDGNVQTLRIGRSDTSAYWQFNHAGDDLRIFNVDGADKDILLSVNSASVDQNNDVGIGKTPSSGYRLDVNGNIRGTQVEAGVADNTSGTLIANGAGAGGGTTGGRIWLRAAADHDTTFDRYQIVVSADDFLIGGDTDTNLFGYYGDSDSWEFRNSGGVLVGEGEGAPACRFHIVDEDNLLGGVTGNSQEFRRLQFRGGTANDVKIQEFAVRDATGTTWTTLRYHNSIAIDASYVTPGTDSRVFWERDPNNQIQHFGSGTDYTLAIDSANDRVGVNIGNQSPDATLHVYANNTSTGSPTVKIEQNGTGDAVIEFELTGGQTYFMGIDNSDGDKFSISTSTDVGSAEAFTISSSGDILIGSGALPTAQLDLRGDYRQRPDADATGVWQLQNSVGTIRARFDTDGGDATLFLRDTADTYTIKLDSAGSSYFNGGNVGIGDTTPDYKLTVNNGGANASGENIVAQFAGGNSLSTIDDETTIYLSNRGDTNLYGAKIALVNTGTSPSFLNPRLDFKTQDISTSAIGGITTKMSILGNGNVGIGTTSPDVKLDVENTKNNAIVRTTCSTDDTSWIDGDIYGSFEMYSLDASNGGAGLVGYVRAVNKSTTTGNRSDLTFGTRDASNLIAEKMRLNYLGYLGIGTADPGVLLEVSDGGASPTWNASTIAAFKNNFNSGDAASIAILAGTAGVATLNFGDSGDEDQGRVRYSNVDNDLEFYTGGVQRLRLHSSVAEFSVPVEGDLRQTEQTLENKTASYTFVVADAGKVITTSGASNITFTVDTNLNLTDGGIIEVDHGGTGTCTIAAGAGVTLNINSNDTLVLDGQWSRAVIQKMAADDTYRVFGQLTPA